MRSLHMMEYHSALRRNEVLTHSTTWVKLEDIIQSESSQTQKDKYCDSTYRKYLE